VLFIEIQEVSVLSVSVNLSTFVSTLFQLYFVFFTIFSSYIHLLLPSRSSSIELTLYLSLSLSISVCLSLSIYLSVSLTLCLSHSLSIPPPLSLYLSFRGHVGPKGWGTGSTVDTGYTGKIQSICHILPHRLGHYSITCNLLCIRF
jgi:hypothetical protein